MTGDQARAIREHFGLTLSEMTRQLNYKDQASVREAERRGAADISPAARARYSRFAEARRRLAQP